MDVKRNSAVNKDLILRERLAIERTTMANNTTLLSFIRTSLYFAVAGLSLNNLLKLTYGFWIELACWLASVVLLITGVTQYYRQKRKIKDSERHVGDYKAEYESH